jgi:hypothetical protein
LKAEEEEEDDDKEEDNDEVKLSKMGVIDKD